MKHNVVDMELLSKDVINMIQRFDIPGVSRLVADVFRITERESLTSSSIPPRSGPKTGSRRSGLTTKEISDRPDSTKFSSPTELYVRCLP